MSKALSKSMHSCWAKWILWGVFTLVIVFLASRHEFWNDEYHVWFMARFLSFRELWEAMTVEGHFLLWFLPVRLLAKLGCSFWCLHLLSISLVSAGAWLLIMKGPFNIPADALILFSYPLIYWFPVISRCYALIPILLFALAYLYREDKHPILYTVLVGLLAHTHAYMEGAVAALFLLWCYERIWIPLKAKRPVRQGIIGAVIILVFVALAYIQVTGSLDYGRSHLKFFFGFFQTWYQLAKAYCPIPDGMSDDIKAGQFSVLSVSLLIMTAVLMLVALFLLFRIFWKQKGNRKFAFVLVVSVAWQFVMSLFVYQFGNHRTYLPLLLVYFALWCVYSKDLCRDTLLLLITFFILTCQCGLMIKDIRGPFCPDMFIYDAVKEKAPLHSQLYVITEPGSNQVIEDYIIPPFIANMFCYEYDEMLVEPPLDGDYQDYLASIFKSRRCREAWCVLINDAALPSNPWYSCETVTEVAGCHLCHITLTDDSLF